MTNKQKQHKAGEKDTQLPGTENDPTIRQEFPGAETNKKKIEAGKRNVKINTPTPPGNDAEPVEEKSDDI